MRNLTFAEHVKEAIIKAKRGIGIIRFLSKYALRGILDQMYKLFVRPNLDYRNIIYHDQNMPLSRKLEKSAKSHVKTLKTLFYPF